MKNAKTNTNSYLAGLFIAAVFLIATNVQAGLIYNLSRSQSDGASKLLSGFSFSLAEINDGKGTRFTFNITDDGIKNTFLSRKGTSVNKKGKTENAGNGGTWISRTRTRAYLPLL